MSEAFIQVSVRLLLGLFCAAIGAFFGALFIAMVFSASDSGNVAISSTRLAFVATTAAAASRLGWYGTAETLRQSITVLVVSALFGMLGSWVALLIAGNFFEHSDLYILNRDISGAGFFGAVFACNVPSVVFAIKLVRRREI